MALTAALAAALTACSAAVALAVSGATGWYPPPALYAAALVPGVVLAARREHPTVVHPERWARVAVTLTFIGILAFLVVDLYWSVEVQDLGGPVLVAVVGLSLAWPDPQWLRASILVAAASLVAVGSGWPDAVVAIGGVLVGAALSLVAVNRLEWGQAPRLGPPLQGARRRVVTAAMVVLVVAGLLAAVVASVVPEPDGGASWSGEPARESEAGGAGAMPNPLGGPLAGELDVTAPRGPFSGDLVLRVNAPGEELWRTLTYDAFDGRIWTRTETRRFPSAGDRVQPFVVDGRGAPVEPFAQRVTIEAPYAAVLPAAFRARTLELPEGGSWALDASVFPEPPLGRGASYRVESDRLTGPPADGGEPVGGPGPAVRDDLAGYLPLPDVAAAVRDRAAGLMGSGDSAYAQARAVEAWLQANLSVELESGPLAPGADAVGSVVFAGAVATPERIATAMAVMLRSQGMPARLVVGFLPGERSWLSGELQVRDGDAYAWVEAWLGPTAGWYRFDPAGLAPPVGAGGESAGQRLERLVRGAWPVLVLVLVVVAVAVLAWLVWRRVRARPGAPPAWATRSFARLVAAGAAFDRHRRAGETPAEYAAALGEVVGDPHLVLVGAVLTAEAWSGREPAPAGAEVADRAAVEQVLADLEERARAERERRRRSRRRRHRSGRGGPGRGGDPATVAAGR